MNIIKKIFCFSVLAFTQFSNAQIYEIDEYNGQTINVCEGVFQDSNAASNGNNYLNNEDYIITICPENSGQNIELDFTVFNTQMNADFLTIYDGPDNTGTGTTYSGGPSQSPGFISATNASGCITIEFFSNVSAANIGWSADISCYEPCQEITNPTISTTPSLNGSILSVDVDQEISFNANADFSSDSSTAIYNWDFGDGSSAQGISPQYTYNTAGSYLITLTITDDCDDNSNTVSIELNAIVGASIPGIPFVDAGDDITLVCDNSTTLRADFLDIGETTDYDVRGIPFVPPFSFSGLENSINIDTDDIWDQAEDFPTDTNGNQFDFCFFNEFQNQFQVGSNGNINFDPLPFGSFNGYDLNGATIPNNTLIQLDQSQIFTPYHDIHPGVNTQNEISWEIIGEFPNRVLAVSYYDVAMWSCNNELASHMAVFYETTNIIDIYIENAPYCNSFSNGKIVGIQNKEGTIAYTPPGRNNTGTWVAQDEAWRFTPIGESIVEFEWVDSDGNFISSDVEIDVDVFDTTSYTAKVTYTTCTGNITIVEDEITVFIDENQPYEVDLGEDLEFCENDGDIELNVDINSPTADYSWTYQGQILQFQDSPTITISSSFSGTYTAVVADQGCVIEDEIVITFVNDDSSFEMTATCDGGEATITGLEGGTFAFDLDPDPTDTAVIDTVNGTITGGAYNTTYSVSYTTNGDCPTTTVQSVTSVEPDDSSFTMIPNCYGGFPNISGLSGGTFSFETNPIDGAEINPSTGVVSGGTANTTYSINYTTNGGCPTTSLFSFTTIIEDDSSFTMTPSCDGGTATITGLAGGTFAFDTVPTDGAIIDAVTGTVTGGGYGTIYLVSYTTNGQCPTTNIFQLTSTEDDDSSFEMISTCDGGTATITGLVGGTFAFDTAPTDGAVIDSSTGTITGGDYDTTYLVSYTTNGDCPTTTIVSVTSIIADDSSFEMISTCDGGTANITGLAGGTFTFDTAPTDGAVIDSSTGTITGGDYDTTYLVSYTTNGDCPTTTIVSVTSIIADDSSFEMISTCDGGTANITGLAGGTFTFDTAPTDGAVIDSSTGTITGGDYDTTYSVSYTTNGECPTTTIVSVTSIEADDSSFEMTPTCDGAAATVTGLVGGTFAFDTAPTDGALIDSSTGIITGGDYNTTYSVSYTTNGDCPTTTIVSVTSIIADDSSFEMTSTCDGGTATVTGLVGGTFAFDTAPTDGALIDSSTGTVSQGGYGVDYIISYTTNGDCPTSSIVNFSSAVLPVISDPTPFEVCDDNIADGFVEMDLSIKNSEITNGNSNYAVTYYLTSEDATTADNQLTLPYTNISNPQTVFIRVVDIIYGCFVTTSMELSVQSAPAANTPSILEYCDADADGFGVFDLTNADAEITSGQTGLVVTYHETQADAENNVNAITGDYNNIVQYQQTIYVRVESATITTTCATYLELLIVVNDVPQIETEPSALEVCDNDTDGFGLFDLSLASEEILNGLDPLDFEVTYYETLDNANAETNPIATPLAYTNVSPFTQDIYVRVENIATECYNTTALTLIVNELPVLIQPDPLELCDDNNTGDEVEEFTLEDSLAQVLNGQTGISITFHETQEDADNADAPIFSPYTNIVNAQTIYLRAENDITGCVSTITLDLRVNPLPSPVTVEPLEACDVDADGFTSFDLESVSEDIINGELDIFITYYETLTDAENALNPLASPYDNIVPNQQTLFVRAENSITGCFSIVDLELISLPSPQLPIVIDDIIICDDDLNGFFQFDLTQNTALILGDQVASEFNLSYHISQEDADTGDNPIVNPETYNNLSNPQTIYVRLESIENLCVSTGEFNLIVSLPPDAIQPLPLEICDDIVADETTVFDLTVKDEEITGGNPWIVEYFETEEDAMGNTNVIADPEAYTNTVVGTNALNPQTLFVRVTDPSTTCYSFVTLTIRVLPNPTPSIDPANIELCDYDTSGDELEVFDITVNEAYIINGEEGVSVTYHETQEDAELGENAIVDPAVYTNITLGQQIIYVRVTNDITACYTIVTFDLIVNPLPDISAADQYIACEIDTDGFFDFDLDTVSASILGTQDPLNFTVTYHETQEDADNGDNVLVSPYTNLTNPQQLFVNITNNTTGCFIAVPSITIEVQEAAQANSDLDRIEYIICDNLADNDGFGTFNLSSQNEEILDGQDPANFTVTYYDNQIDAELGTNPLANSYENTSNPQIIYARVDNDTTADAQCYATTDLTLIVNLLPEFFLEDVYLGCVNVNGTELIDPVVMDIGLDPALYSFEWFDPTGTLVSTSVTYTPLVGGTFTAIATNLATGCQNTVTTLVDPSSPPEVSAVVTTEFFADLHVIEASATGEGIYEFSLDDGPWQTSGTFEDVTPGFHTVIARDVNGCGTGTTQVLVIDYPHFFTPNGDGYNDTWRVEGIETRPQAKIYIYDRFGKLLKQLSPLGPGWDGTFNGENLPATDYWFTIRLDVVFGDAESVIKEFTGHFSLKR